MGRKPHDARPTKGARASAPARATASEKRKDARIRELEARVAELEAEPEPVRLDGQAVGAASAARDVTENARTEHALREANVRLEAEIAARTSTLRAERQRLYDVLETLPAMICLLTPDHHVRFANRAFREKFGEANGRRCYEYCFGLSAPCAFCEAFKALETGQPHHWEVTTPDGASVIAAHDYPFTDADGSRLVLEMDIDITAQKRNEAELRRLQVNLAARVDAVMQALPVGVAITDAAGANVSSNTAFERIWAESRPPVRSLRDYEAYKAWWVDTGQPLTPEEWASARVLQTGQPVIGQLIEIQRFDGSRAFVLNSAAPVRDASGSIVGAAVALQDVTELRKAEQELRESEERYRRLFENLNSAVILAEPILDRGGRLVDLKYLVANPAVSRHLKKAPNELVGRRYSEVFHHPGRNPVFDVYEQVLATGESYRGEMLLPALNRHYDIAVYRPTPSQLALVLSDITDRKQAEEALSDSEERFRVAQEISPDGFSILRPVRDADGRAVDFTWVYANPALERIVAMPMAALTGRRLLELFPGHRGSSFLDAYRRVADTGRTCIEEGCYHGEGTLSERWFRVAVVAIGQDIAVLSQDITERKRAEDDLRKANLLLAEADRRKNEFLAVLSHELRNPLAPIANSLYVLDHASPGSEQAERARQVIGRQVSQLSNLVNDLLDVTRITRNKVQLQKERIELNETVRRVVEDNRSLFERAGVSLELVPAARPIPVHADGTRVAQVVGNLLHNAAKFTSNGGHTRVSVAVEGSEAVVRVADDGVGMSRETLDRLFQPFSQAEQTLDRSKGGLGLGLALVKGLVELHGGTASARSEGLGRGTEMIVWLPLDTGAALEAAAARADAARARRRVLIIEDNPDAADSLGEALALGDHEVAVAYNGPDGIARARKFLPDVVLCDIGLPGMSGYDVARAFRADETLRGTFLVALSGYALPEDLQRAADAGFERHLAKPPTVEKLEDVLGSVPARSNEA